MDFFNDIFHNLALLEFYFLNIIYILLYIDFILSIFFQHSNILTRASHHWCLASNIVLVHWLIFPYPPGLLRWHCGNLTIALVPAKQPWWIWINTSCEFIMKDYITTTKPCAYFLGYTVRITDGWWGISPLATLIYVQHLWLGSKWYTVKSLIWDAPNVKT